MSIATKMIYGDMHIRVQPLCNYLNLIGKKIDPCYTKTSIAGIRRLKCVSIVYDNGRAYAPVSDIRCYIDWMKEHNKKAEYGRTHWKHRIKIFEEALNHFVKPQLRTPRTFEEMKAAIPDMSLIVTFRVAA